MAAVMMSKEPASGKQGQAALPFPPPRSKYHLCESAATWLQEILLPDGSTSPLWKQKSNPFPTLQPTVDIFQGPTMITGFFPTFTQSVVDFDSNKKIGVGGAWTH